MELTKDIVLLQRGDPVVLSLLEYNTGWASPVEVLAANNILTIERRGDGVAVRPGNFVGLARTPQGLIRIAPRSEHLLNFLLHTFRDAARLVSISGLSGPGNYYDIVAQAFDCCRRVISSGGPPEYQKLVSDTASRGSFAINDSMRKFWSRGMAHRAVRTYSKLKRPSSAAALAGQVLVRIQTDYVLSDNEHVDFQRLVETLGRPSDWNTQQVPALIDQVRLSGTPDLLKLGDIAETVFSLGSPEIGAISGSGGDLTFRFYDTETLWEQALAELLSPVVDGGSAVRVHPLRKTASNFLAKAGPNIDPDIIVYGDDHSPSIIIDAKSFHATRPSATDVYQMFAYMTHVECRAAVIVYICNGPSWQKSIDNGNVAIHSIGIGIEYLATRASAQAELSRLWKALPGQTEP